MAFALITRIITNSLPMHSGNCRKNGANLRDIDIYLI